MFTIEECISVVTNTKIFIADKDDKRLFWSQKYNKTDLILCTVKKHPQYKNY